MNEADQYDVRVEAVTEYVAAQSDPANGRFAFAYHITVTNHGSIAARLMSRHWVITDGTGEVEEVRGDGVVGKQPTIVPGEHHRYTSGAILSTPVGTMHGSYRMVAADGHAFDAIIEPFRLAVPHTLN
ncbi:Co2+/Mg2+ efflux protein ApaG [Pseudazoarcus pumilus]|uniref:Protein ApaG n=1 Tax=Pseudazoarcus pumilus TaxID=2067960 RepID=A0A2I6S4A6_9RHOO|nr:Co2+/Mg2+ efflux protein ApaG [Pseudazoarcus pumilus]AUN94067.1 Co2+/Mg2+ efflux protein ApaG [Pseudazoarcus pumilus]